MRTLFVGCVHLSRKCLDLLLRDKSLGVEICGIVTKAKSTFHADFSSLQPLALEAGLPYFLYESSTQPAEMQAWIERQKADMILVIGWSHLLPEAIFDLPAKGAIGFHPAKLPENRGRHPLIWALALGLEETASTFFLMRREADSGPILSQRLIPIGKDDDAGRLYGKIEAAALGQLKEFLPPYVRGELRPIPQDESRASSWRKRGIKDGEIDWRMPAQGIFNLVRALAPPYGGAHFMSATGEVKVWKVELVDYYAPNAEPGKVLESGENGFVVKCGIGALRVLSSGIGEMPKEGKYL